MGNNTDDASNSSHKEEISNFLSNCGDNFSCGVYLDIVKRRNKSSSSCSVSSGIEKNFDFLNTDENNSSNHELNKAKLDQSIENSQTGSSRSQHSEHYDEVDEYSPNSIKDFKKRMSLE